MISDALKNQLNQKGIKEEIFNEQIANFKTGFPYANLNRAATPNDGIQLYSEKAQTQFALDFEHAQSQLDILKFVPASGAASRMFKFLFTALNADSFPNDDLLRQFFKDLEKFPFYRAIPKAYLEDLSTFNEQKKLVDLLLNHQPFQFGIKPKAMIPFHKGANGFRLSFEEHFAEALFFANGKNGLRLHFTISPEHKEMFEAQKAIMLDSYEELFENGIEVTFSEQKSSTDVIAVGLENNPVATEGGFLFRPGGHGALIENLNDVDADVIFVKNIDNVLPPVFHDVNGFFKRFMGGVLLHLQNQLFELQRNFHQHGFSHELANKAEHFASSELGMKEIVDLGDELKLKSFLFKPVRVCGMVKNEGEPGGGPFWVESQNGETSLQIVEKSQIDIDNEKQLVILENSTHFNPVDIVCGTRDFKGKKFNLKEFVDPTTGFITYKSHEGKEIKAQELPGLWNGAMANWHTLFVEVPLVTFNPVKTVNDLLKENHQK